jgi:hypothetical protein
MLQSKEQELFRLEEEIVVKRKQGENQVDLIIDLTTKAKEKGQEEALIVSIRHHCRHRCCLSHRGGPSFSVAHATLHRRTP